MPTLSPAFKRPVPLLMELLRKTDRKKKASEHWGSEAN
jgi:hypothetical protein